MRKIFFIFPLILISTVLTLILFTKPTYYHRPENETLLINISPPSPFVPQALLVNENPLGLMPVVENSKWAASNSLGQSSRTILIGFEGLNWTILNHLVSTGKAPNLSWLILAGSRGILLTGDSGYATPQKGWRRVLTGKNEIHSPSLKRKFSYLENNFSDGDFLFIDMPLPETKNRILFFDGKKLSVTPITNWASPLDSASEKLSYLKDKNFDGAFIAINEPDKTQHRALLGYFIFSINEVENLKINPDFEELFRKNNFELEKTYKELDRFVGTLMNSFPSYNHILFSVHGAVLFPFDNYLNFSQKWFEGVGITGGSNTTEPLKVTLKINNGSLEGTQKTYGILTPVITDKETGKETSFQIRYPKWEFDIPEGMFGGIYCRRIINELNVLLKKDMVHGVQPILAGYSKGKILIYPNTEFLKMAPFDSLFEYGNGISVTRVQAGHPGAAAGIFIAKGKGFEADKIIKPMELKDIIGILH